jgi:hypothetical protein
MPYSLSPANNGSSELRDGDRVTRRHRLREQHLLADEAVGQIRDVVELLDDGVEHGDGLAVEAHVARLLVGCAHRATRRR